MSRPAVPVGQWTEHVHTCRHRQILRQISRQIPSFGGNPRTPRQISATLRQISLAPWVFPQAVLSGHVRSAAVPVTGVASPKALFRVPFSSAWAHYARDTLETRPETTSPWRVAYSDGRRRQNSVGAMQRGACDMAPDHVSTWRPRVHVEATCPHGALKNGGEACCQGRDDEVGCLSAYPALHV